MAFHCAWRSYQERLLSQLETFLEARRFHLVAAPGSGKTLLGLEVVRRIGKPTLVLVPTLPIRDQWVDRLVERFLPEGARRPAWVSTDLRHPAALTVSTYQALHALCAGEPAGADERAGVEASVLSAGGNDDGDEPLHAREPAMAAEAAPASALPEVLLRAGFGAVVVDEAHHMRAAWWKTLTAVVDRLDDPIIVALTATPPYDVPALEWQHYAALCGPVDAEVPIPELVLHGDLCPHQDYVFLSLPSPREQAQWTAFRASVEAFVLRLRARLDFTATLAAHPWLTQPDAHVEEILENPPYLSSMAVYLHTAGEPVPATAVELLGTRHVPIPDLDLAWIETLLNGFLDEEPAANPAPERESLVRWLRHELTQIGALHGHGVRLQRPVEHERLLTTAVTKLQSIVAILRLEAGALGDELRCVILTDFVRRSEMAKSAAAGEQGDGLAGFADVGVVPIFEALRLAAVAGVRLAVLSGSLVIIPAAAMDALRQAAAAAGMRPDDLALRPLPHAAGYAAAEIHGDHGPGMVGLVTAVFEQGCITVLVGTKSLLGEGWDAPAINTLVLASFVGSYVLSNQMRGRSIRIDPRRPDKTANIWHLVCVEPGPLGPGADYDLLARRCGAFVGVSVSAPVIESGIRRFGLPEPPFRHEAIDRANERTCRYALDRAAVRRRWQEALETATPKRMAPGLRLPTRVLPRHFVLANTIGALLVQASALFATVISILLRLRVHTSSAEEGLRLCAIFGALAAAVSLPLALRAGWRFLRHGTPERSLGAIGNVLLESLGAAHLLKQPADLRVTATALDDGTVTCWVSGGTGREQALFLNALREILGPLASPRYLLARSRFKRFLGEDYFAVPEALARKSAAAQAFAGLWRRRVGPVNLVNTRTPEGRRILLRARIHSLAATFQPAAERVSCWR
jgi:superfamily II DNA or RNA helicase